MARCSSRLCYSEGNGTPQNVDLEDVAFIAKYLRSYSRQIKPGRFLTMDAKDTAGRGEWSVYSRRSTLVTVKHINDTVDSSVLFEDIATAIDGGEKATPEQQQAALLGCGVNGGAVEVQANASKPCIYGGIVRGCGLQDQRASGQGCHWCSGVVFSLLAR